MTTIAYHRKEKQIAFDGRLTAPGGFVTTNEAFKCIEDGEDIWFIAGSLHDHQLLIDIHNGDKSVDYELDAYALRCDKDGNVCLCANDQRGNPTIEPLSHNYAIGSGYAFAFAAMDFGESAVGAVKYASTRNSCTGGQVRFYDIKKGVMKYAS